MKFTFTGNVSLDGVTYTSKDGVLELPDGIGDTTVDHLIASFGLVPYVEPAKGSKTKVKPEDDAK